MSYSMNYLHSCYERDPELNALRNTVKVLRQDVRHRDTRIDTLIFELRKERESNEDCGRGFPVCRNTPELIESRKEIEALKADVVHRDAIISELECKLGDRSLALGQTKVKLDNALMINRQREGEITQACLKIAKLTARVENAEDFLKMKKEAHYKDIEIAAMRIGERENADRKGRANKSLLQRNNLMLKALAEIEAQCVSFNYERCERAGTDER